VTDVIRAEIEIYFTGIFVGGTEENWERYHLA
jgi:hypothetical protein